MLVFDGTDIVKGAEAVGAGRMSTGPDPEAGSCLAAEEGVSDGVEWEEWKMGSWTADTGVDLDAAGVGAGVSAESEMEAVESRWGVVGSNTLNSEGAGRAMELDGAP